MPSKIEIALIKALNNQASKSDLEELELWLSNPDNEELFRSYLSTHIAINSSVNRFNSETAKSKLLREIHREKRWRSKKKFFQILKYSAAVLLLLLGIGIFFQNKFLSGPKQMPAPGNEYVTLEREDGSVEILKPQESREVRNSVGAVVGKQEKNSILYSEEYEVEDLVYNTLKVPYGKKFKLELSDGSLVHLNSGSSITYPIKFLKNESRTVKITGEAFFEVSSDPQHPFLVQAGSLNIRVTGTRFNVSAYSEDPVTEVVLVEGKVALYSDNSQPEQATELTPGNKGSFDRQQQLVDVEKVNVDLYTAWRRGELVFRNMTFNNILKKLERNFHVKIINKNEELGKQLFNASFNNEKLKTILEDFDVSYDIKYEIKDNKIIFE